MSAAERLRLDVADLRRGVGFGTAERERFLRDIEAVLDEYEHMSAFRVSSPANDAKEEFSDH